MLSFQESILRWYDENKRILPWRDAPSPYSIWISEVILQQTRVDQGTPYYLRFLKTFPNVNSLAEADENSVLAVWQGLGYYARARKLHEAAKIIASGGNAFPNTYDSLMSLPGIGPYTAAAIASIAFGEVVPAIDGNAYRIISRVFNIADPITGNAARKGINSIAKEWISKSRPGDFNQALMDLGATICKPRNPICSSCPLQYGCEANFLKNFHERPVKISKKNSKHRFLIFDLHLSNKKVGFVKISQGNIWRNLFLFPFTEYENEELFVREVERMQEQGALMLCRDLHVLSHQKIHFNTRMLKSTIKPKGMVWRDLNRLEQTPVPAIITKILTHWEYKISRLI
ncbi:MAG: A/G-specific adenine glycosylase [Bacteroidetes bacterium]|nr:A/G-specific adenine glycosylase [Bacteroidota bacterium]